MKPFTQAELIAIALKQKCYSRYDIKWWGRPSIVEVLQGIDWREVQRKGMRKRGKRNSNYMLDGAEMYTRALVTGGVHGVVGRMKLLDSEATREMLEEILDLYHRCIFGPTWRKLEPYLQQCVAAAENLTMALKDHHAPAMTDRELGRCSAGGDDRRRLYDRALSGCDERGKMAQMYDDRMDQAYDRIDGVSNYVD